ncbi:MAG: LLM class flavin-dependent oxidoreductase, partial [Actinomycetota bacterium]
VAATVDRISDGRLTLGVGAGWQVNEHRAYGIDLLAPKDRVDRFEEAIQIIRSLLGTERTTFHGRHFHITDAPCRPMPIQDPLPLLVGTGGPRMSVITARHADQWNTWGHVAEAGRRLTTIEDACARVGRDPSSLHRSVQALFFRADDPQSVDRLRAAAPADRSIIGNADTMIEALRDYRELGFDEVIVPDFTLGRDAAERLDSYHWFESDVLPNV